MTPRQRIDTVEDAWHLGTTALDRLHRARAAAQQLAFDIGDDDTSISDFDVAIEHAERAVSKLESRKVRLRVAERRARMRALRKRAAER